MAVTPFITDTEATQKIQQSYAQLESQIDGISSGYRGTIALADTPTEDGIYTPTEDGTYTNAGSLVYAPETTDKGKITTFILFGGVWTKNSVPVEGISDVDLIKIKKTLSVNKAYSSDFATGGINVGGGFIIEGNLKRIINRIGIPVEEGLTYDLMFDFFKFFAIHFYNDTSYVSGTTINPGATFTVPPGANNVKFQFTNQSETTDIDINDIPLLNLYVGDLNEYIDFEPTNKLTKEFNIDDRFNYIDSVLVFGGASASDRDGLTQDKSYISFKYEIKLDAGKYTFKLTNPDGFVRYNLNASDLSGNNIPIGSPPAGNLDGFTIDIQQPFTLSATFNKPDTSIITDEQKNNFKIFLYKENVKYAYWKVIDEVEEFRANKLEYQINNRKNKLLTVIGDSISFGYIPRNDPGHPGNLNSYAKLASENLGMKFQNLATSGSSMKQLISKVPQTGIMADVIVVMAGTNDIRTYNVLGSFGDTTDTSFYGCCYQMAFQLLNKHRQTSDNPSRTQIIFCSPIKLGIDIEATYGTNKMSDYVLAVKKTAEYFSIPYLDMYNLSGINPHLFRTLQGTEPGYTDMYNPLIPDGVHPNQKGHEIMSKVLTGFIKSIG